MQTTVLFSPSEPNSAPTFGPAPVGGFWDEHTRWEESQSALSPASSSMLGDDATGSPPALLVSLKQQPDHRWQQGEQEIPEEAAGEEQQRRAEKRAARRAALFQGLDLVGAAQGHGPSTLKEDADGPWHFSFDELGNKCLPKKSNPLRASTTASIP